MKKYLLTSVAALGLIAAGAASAADLPSRKGPVVAPAYVPAFTWTGFYVGANAGYGWGNVNTNAAVSIGDLDGFIGGGQVGYNYQIGQFVLGAEADFQGADLDTGKNILGASVKTEYFGTVDHGGEPPARFAAAALVVLNKIDRLPDDQRVATLDAIMARVTARNPDAYLVRSSHGRIDPRLLLDGRPVEVAL